MDIANMNVFDLDVTHQNVYYVGYTVILLGAVLLEMLDDVKNKFN